MDPQGSGRPLGHRDRHLDPGLALEGRLVDLRDRQQPAGGVPERRVGRPDEDPRIWPHGSVRCAGGAEPHREHRDRDARSRALYADERRRGRPRRRQPRRRPGRRVRSHRRGHDPPDDPDRYDVARRQHQPRDRPAGPHPHRSRNDREPRPDPAGARMSGVAGTSPARGRRLTSTAWFALFRDRPMIPLLALLGILVGASEVVRPGIVDSEWTGVILRTSVPLAILAACQTLTMLTGGIDLSVGAVASMSGFIVASLVGPVGLPAAIAVALVAAAFAGLVTGIGVGVFRVHPLIMTLGMSLVVLGLANVWQLQTIQTNAGVPPELRWLGSQAVAQIFPASLLVFVPLAALILVGLRRTGYGRLLYAIGDNPIAARLSGARSWQILVVLYITSA